MRIYLVGISCVGKTTVGALLAERLGYESLDFDEEAKREYKSVLDRNHPDVLTVWLRDRPENIFDHLIFTDDYDNLITEPVANDDNAWHYLGGRERTHRRWNLSRCTPLPTAHYLDCRQPC